MATLTKAERELLSLAIRTIGDTLRHVDMRQGERECLQMAADDLRALYKAATKKEGENEPA